MEWTVEVLRDIMRVDDKPVSSDNQNEAAFYDDWRNDPERADLLDALSDEQKEAAAVPQHPWDEAEAGPCPF